MNPMSEFNVRITGPGMDVDIKVTDLFDLAFIERVVEKMKRQLLHTGSGPKNEEPG